MISKEELKKKVLNSLKEDWIATTRLANSIGIHPSRVQNVLLELLNEEEPKVEQLTRKIYTYWRIPKINLQEETKWEK